VKKLSENNEKKKYRVETVALHGGYEEVEPHSRSRVVPIYQTTSFTFKDDKHAANLFALKEAGNIYTRIMNPTSSVLEDRIAQLEHGAGALALSSGMSAESIALMTLLKKGDEFVSSSEIYGGSYTLFQYTLRKFGIDTKFVKPEKPENFQNAITSKTKALYVETLGNPKLYAPNFEEIAKIAHDNEIPLIVDNTFASPYLCTPIDFGADIVVHSTTKYISGHGYAIGGVIVDSGKFPWHESKHYQWFNAPEPSYHGMNFHEAFGNMAFIAKCRVQTLRDIGAAPSPFNSWLTLVGLETLPVRMDRTCSNAMEIAKFLKHHPKVAWVSYPGLFEGEWKKLLDRYMPRGYSGMLAFGVKGGLEAGIKLINSVKLISHLANVGDAKSLIIHPASTTHQQLSEQEQLDAGITPDFIRLSVGIENIDDLKEDLDQALSS
jgi:O-acetylhomoserine (thiol)-lyase